MEGIMGQFANPIIKNVHQDVFKIGNCWPYVGNGEFCNGKAEANVDEAQPMQAELKDDD